MSDLDWWCFFSLLFTDSDSLSSSSELQAPTKSEIFCNSQEQDKFLPDEGPQSSLLMDLNPGKTVNSCKRFFTAPTSSGMFVQLIKKDTGNDTTMLAESDNGSISNTTQYCPISIVSFIHDLGTEMIHQRSQSPARASHLSWSSFAK